MKRDFGAWVSWRASLPNASNEALECEGGSEPNRARRAARMVPTIRKLLQCPAFAGINFKFHEEGIS
jgi:hypothetical protein